MRDVKSILMKSMNKEQNSKTSAKIAAGTIAGALIGAAAGLVLAPKSGKETRQDVAKAATSAKKRIGTSNVIKDFRKTVKTTKLENDTDSEPMETEDDFDDKRFKDY